jgi:hypothetical protein
MVICGVSAGAHADASVAAQAVVYFSPPPGLRWWLGCTDPEILSPGPLLFLTPLWPTPRRQNLKSLLR